LDQEVLLYWLQPGWLDLSDIEQLEVWTEEGWRRREGPLDVLRVRLAPGVVIELQSVAEDG
jgi:hypothetical protein